MTGEVVELDAQRPHFSISCECGAHVVPELYLERVAANDPMVLPLPDCLQRAILRGWLRMMAERAA